MPDNADASPTTRRRGRPRKDEEPVDRERLLDAALHAFAVHGYQGVSIRTLSRELGVSHNALHQRYGTKESLWYAAVDHGFEPLVTELDSYAETTDTWEKRLRGLIYAFVVYSARHPDLLRLVDKESAHPSDRLEYLVDRFVRPGSSALTKLYDDIADETGTQLPLRSMHFLITRGGASLFANQALARLLDANDDSDPLAHDQVESHARFVSDVIAGGISAHLRRHLSTVGDTARN